MHSECSVLFVETIIGVIRYAEKYFFLYLYDQRNMKQMTQYY